MSIIIGADIVPIESNYELFRNSCLDKLIGTDLKAIMEKADFRIFNLETPLTDRLQPIMKYGPHLAAPVFTIAAIKAMNIDLLSLANNHIMDQDAQGLASTIQALDESAISHLGAGKNLSEAQKPYFFELKNKRYGVYACSEHEFSIAENNQPGANPFDPLESLDHISWMKSQCDYVIILYHGGKEHYRYPSPNLRKTCQKMIDKGANLVVCQHSHCIGCKEDYLNGIIVYGQGNYIFNKRSNEFWDTSLLIQLEDNGHVSFIPIKKQGNGVLLAVGKEADEILSGFEERSNEIKQPGFVEKQYKAFADETITGYLLYFIGIQNNIVYRAINKISGQRLRRYISKHIKKKRSCGIRNYIECEAHRELLLKGLELQK